MKRSGRSRSKRRSIGESLQWIAGQEAYRDASYAILLERMERFLRDPERRERVFRAEAEVLKDMLKDLEEEIAGARPR